MSTKTVAIFIDAGGSQSGWDEESQTTNPILLGISSLCPDILPGSQDEPTSDNSLQSFSLLAIITRMTIYSRPTRK